MNLIEGDLFVRKGDAVNTFNIEGSTIILLFWRNARTLQELSVNSIDFRNKQIQIPLSQSGANNDGMHETFNGLTR